MPFPSFKRIMSSDESDMSDDEKPVINQNPSPLESVDNNSQCLVPQTSAGTVENGVKASKKLEIVENRSNKNKRFSIWSEILMEEELNEAMNDNLKLKKRRRKAKKGEKESDNYSFWTREDFQRKFAVKKTKDLKQKIKGLELKRDASQEISRQLKESRVDIIRRIVQVIGDDKARQLTTEVLNIESGGGLMTADGARRRSPGGVLFYLVKNEPDISAEQKHSIFGDSTVRMNDKQMKKSKQARQGSNNLAKKKKKNKKSKNKKNRK